MIGGGWRIRAWGAPRATLAAVVGVTAVALTGRAPSVHLMS